MNDKAEIAVIHFWHPDLLHEVHPGSGEGGVTCSDDLRRVTCTTCRDALVTAVRTTPGPVVTPPGSTDGAA